MTMVMIIIIIVIMFLFYLKKYNNIWNQLLGWSSKGYFEVIMIIFINWMIIDFLKNFKTIY